MKCSEVPHPVQIKRHLFLVVVCVGQRRGLVGAHGGGPGTRLRVRRADVVHAALAEAAEGGRLVRGTQDAVHPGKLQGVLKITALAVLFQLSCSFPYKS